MALTIWYSMESATRPRRRCDVELLAPHFPDTQSLAEDIAELCAQHFVADRDELNDWPDEGSVEFYLFRDDNPDTEAAWCVSVAARRIFSFTGFAARLPKAKPAAIPEAGEFKADGNVVFALDTDGTNRIYAQVQAAGGHDVPQAELEKIARRFAYSDKMLLLLRELTKAPGSMSCCASFDYLKRKARDICEELDER